MKKILPLIISSLLISNVALAKDEREVIVVTIEERDAFLTEMRNMLKSSQQVLQGVITNDMKMVEKAALASGMKMARETPASLRKKLPKGFKKIGPLAHRGFGKIANEASAFGDSNKILTLLAETQKSCISCHNAYQIQVEK